MDNKPTTDWSLLVFGESWLQKFEQVARRRFGESSLADEAVTYVIEALSDDDWQRMSSFQGKAKPRTFLNTVATNLLEEFARKRFGRVRPPSWLKRNGDLWVTIWRQICLERQPDQSVISRCLSTTHEEVFLKNIVGAIKAKIPWCGHKIEELPTSTLEPDTNENDYFDRHHSEIDDPADLDHSLESILYVIHSLLDKPNDNASDAALTSELGQYLDKVHNELKLSARESLLLRLVYLEGLKQRTVAEALSIPPYQLSRDLKALQRRIRDSLGQVQPAVILRSA